MLLQNQIHVYSLDTSGFYTPEEMILHRKLIRLYSLRKQVSAHGINKYQHYRHQRLRLSRLIKYFKEQLVNQFQVVKQQGIIRNLREDVLNDRNVVSLFESSLTRTLECEIDQLTTDMFIVRVFFFEVAEDLIKHGCYYNGQKYVLFSASAGQIRTKKFVMVRENLYRAKEKTLTCGLTVDEINQRGGINVNKYLAYLALANSATEIWEEFDIDKSIVVDDFETLVQATVDYVDDETYEIERKTMDVPIPHMDGAGIMLHNTTRMVRLPFVKGLMIQCPYDQFIREKCENGQAIVTDIYGQEHDILGEDIQYIFTKSQFKMAKYYDSWQDYKQNFKIYHCEAGYCNIEEPYISDAEINYQMLQTLTNATKEDMQKIAQPTLNWFNRIGNDFQTTMELLGATESNQYKSSMQKCLMLYPELMREKYNRSMLSDLKHSVLKQARAGRLKVNGKFTFVSPDVYAFCEWLFLGEKNPQGLLRNGEVSCNLYDNGRQVDCLRSPHLYKEHAIRTNVVTDETKRWFTTKCIYISVHDAISKVLQCDFDGDRLLVIQDSFFCNVAKRNMKNIVPLYYNMRKAEPTQLTKNTLFQGLTTAYTGGNIGIYSNNISKIWNSGHVGDAELKIVKLLCMENNFVIDFAKTLYKPTRTESAHELIQPYTKQKLPYFFQYAKNKTIMQTESWISTPVNYLTKIFLNFRLTLPKQVGRFDYRLFLDNPDFVFGTHHQAIIDLYDYYQTHKWSLYNHDEEPKADPEKIWLYKKIKERLLELPFSADEILDALVVYLFDKRPSSAKKTLWNCFGGELYKRLKCNMPENAKYCPICGKRMDGDTRKYCSETCRKKSYKVKKKLKSKK